jgi:hypothetical protein
MTNFIDVLSVCEDRAKQMTEYLVDLNPRDYRDHAHWFKLMCECHHAGVDRKVFHRLVLSRPRVRWRRKGDR